MAGDPHRPFTYGGESLGRLALGAAFTGALAGVLCALADFGASFLWLSLLRNKGLLLLSLLGSLGTAGALLGALGAIAYHLGDRLLGRRGLRWEPLGVFVLLAVPAALVGHSLFDGGKMRKLSGRAFIEPLVIVGLLVGVYLALLIGFRVLRLAERRRQGVVAALMLFGLGFALGKADQWFYPGLYGALHDALSVAQYGCFLFGLLAAMRALGLTLQPRRATALLVVVGALACASFFILRSNANVKVVSFESKASNSRSLLRLVGPLLRTERHRPRSRPRPTTNPRPERPRVTILPTADQAHVLLVTIDALRADRLGTYGYERETSPFIDSLAAESLVFEHAYAQAPHSSYSISSLMSSEYLHETLALDQPLPEATLASVFSESDVHTAAFFTLGIFHTEGEALARYKESAYGFDYHEHRDLDAAGTTERALAEVARIKERGEPRSMLWVHYFDVHDPYEDTRFGTGDSDRYDSEIRKVDEQLQRLVTEMESELEREVIVAITADHGEEFRDHGGVNHGSTLYEEQVRVPLILRAPDLEPARIAAPVELVDVAPTLLHLAGIAAPSSMRGRDVRELRGVPPEEARAAFSAVIHKRMGVKWPHKLIADLRFGLFELYDLSADPLERHNLAGEEQELLEEMKGEVYGWLDSLAELAESDPRSVALDQGRLGDRRSVPLLSAMVEDPSAPAEMRAEACQILGHLNDASSSDSLFRAMSLEPAEVAAEAAIALGRHFDARARDPLRQLVHVEDPEQRTRAAVSLGRIRDVAAVPALIDALWVATERYEREEAVRWLGRLRDPRAVEPLLHVMSEFRFRRLAVIALGMIADPRATSALVEALGWETHVHVRDALVEALGQMEAKDQLSVLLGLSNEVDLESLGETLERLDAVGSSVGGQAMSNSLERRPNVTSCEEGERFQDWAYRNRTQCELTPGRITLPIAVPAPLTERDEIWMWVRTKQLDGSAGELALTLPDGSSETITLDSQWRTVRTKISSSRLQGRARIQLVSEARYQLDHVLFVPVGE